MIAYLSAGIPYAVRRGGDTLGYYRADPEPLATCQRTGLSPPYGCLSDTAVRTTEAALAVIRHAGRIAHDAGETRIVVTESHETLIAKTMLSLGGDYLLRHSCPFAGLDAEMACIIDLTELSQQLHREFTSRLQRSGAPPAALSIGMGEETVSFDWDGSGLAIDSKPAPTHRPLPRWVTTRLYMGYYSGADVLALGGLPGPRRVALGPRTGTSPLSARRRQVGEHEAGHRLTGIPLDRKIAGPIILTPAGLRGHGRQWSSAPALRGTCRHANT